MKLQKVSFLKLDLNLNVINYNLDFVRLLGFNVNDFHSEKFIDEAKELITNISAHLNSLGLNASSRILLFKKYTEVYASSNTNIILIYTLIEKTTEGYIIRLTNWLNWIHNIYESLDNSYYTIHNLVDSFDKDRVLSLTETYWFKALLPLLLHIPKKFIYTVSSRAYFDLLSIFSNKRGGNYFSKDYNRDFVSRIKNKIKKDTGINCIDIQMLIKDNSLIDLTDGEQLIIRGTVLKEDILIIPNQDIFLESILSFY